MDSGIVTIVIIALSFLVSILITVGVIFFIWKMVLGPLMKNRQQEQQLLATGQRASGQIMAVSQTGMYVNNQPQVRIDVQVQPPGGQPYAASMTKVLNMMAIPRVQPGAQVAVRYDPANPQRVAIEGI